MTPRPIVPALPAFTALLVISLLLVPRSVGAQVRPDTARAAGADTARADTGAIPMTPIRVTVLRAPLLLSRTPYAVTVEPARSGGPGLTLAAALAAVPGVQVDNRYNFSQGDRISVRGLGARAQFGVRGVKVLVDGIPATLPDGQTSLSHLDPRWVERAEVVRGPASSLWGNAAGGVIQLETAGPPGSGSDASATWLMGAHGLRHYGGEAGAGVRSAGRPGLGIRAAASRLLYGGFREHGAADKRFGSARVEWTGARDAVTVVAHGVSYEAENPGSLTADALAADPAAAYGFNVVQDAGEAARQGQVGVTWVRRPAGSSPGTAPTAGPGWPPGAPSSSGAGGGAGPVLEVSGWVLARWLDNPIPPAIIALSRRAAGVRGSVRGAGEVGGRAVSWVVGLDAEGQWDDRQNFENLAGDPGGLLLDQAERVWSVAPFAELTAPLGPVRAMAGLRWDRYRFTAEDRLVSPTDPDDSGSRVMGQVSPSLGVTTELGAASAYANVTSSFETPTTTELANRPGGGAGFNPALEPQRAWSVEAGLRTPLGSRARLHAAAYRTAIRDALIPFEVEGAPGRSYFRNAGSAVHRGLELDVWAELAPSLRLRLGWSWVDARFDAFVTDDLDASGNRVPGVAPHRVRGAVAWTAGGGRVELEGRWMDAVPVDDGNTARAPSHSLLDLRAASPTLPLAGGVAVFGGVDNLLDARYVTSVVGNAFGSRYYEPGPRRSAYLGLRLGSGR